jgi:hypothetical protein
MFSGSIDKSVKPNNFDGKIKVPIILRKHLIKEVLLMIERSDLIYLF